MADQNFDPEMIRALNEGFSDLKQTLDAMANSQAIDKMQRSLEKAGAAHKKVEEELLASKGLYKDLNGKIYSRASLEEKLNKELEIHLRQQAQLNAETKTEQELFKDALRARGLEIDETGKIVKIKKVEIDATKKLTDEQLKLVKAAETRIKREEEYSSFVKKSGNDVLEDAKKLTNFSSITDHIAQKMAGPEGLGKGAAFAIEALKALATGLMEGTKVWYKSIGSGEKANVAGAKAVLEFVKSISTFISTIGGLAVAFGSIAMFIPGMQGLGIAAIAGGAALVGLSKAAVSVTETLVEAQEYLVRLNDSYYELSNSGAQFNKGMTGVYETMQKVGMGKEDFAKFNALMKDNVKNLKMFGDVTAQGIDRFANISNSLLTSDFSKQLESWGVSFDEQREHVLKYMAQETRMNNLRGKTDEQLRQGAAKYIDELDKLTELTGASRKEQEDARNAVLKMEQLRAAIVENQLQLEKEMDPVRKKELEFRKSQLETGFKVASSLYAGGARQAAAGIAGLTATGGAPTDAASSAVLLQFRNLVQGISKGNLSNEEMIKLMGQDIKNTQQNTASLAKFGTNLEGYAPDTQVALDELRKAIGEGAKTPEEIAAAVAKRRKSAEEDKTTKDQIEANRIAKDAALTQTSVLKLLGDTSIPLFNSASQALKTAADRLAQLGGIQPTRFSGTSSATGTAGAGAGAGAAPSPGSRRGTMRGVMVGPAEGSVAMSQADLMKRGLRLKQGDVQAEGAGIHPNIIALAEKIQNEIPGFNYFSSFNDQYHAMDSNSMHSRGLALDFTLTQTPTKEEGARIASRLKELGASYVLDEYNNKSSGWTGGHFHAQVGAGMQGAATGGLFTGPNSGYPVLLHGNEAVLNQSQLMGLEKVLSQVTKQEFSDSSITSTVNSPMQEMISMHEELMETLITKLGDLESRMARSNDIQENILNYSMT